MIAPQLLFDWMHQAPIYSETDNLGEVWTTASVTCPQDLFHFRCLRHQFSTFEADPYPTRSCPWKCTNIRLCRLCPLLVIYYLHFYKIDRISRATFFFFGFSRISHSFRASETFHDILWHFDVSRFFSFLLVSSCRGAQATSQRAREAEPTEAAAICPKLKTKLSQPSPEKFTNLFFTKKMKTDRTQAKTSNRTIGVFHQICKQNANKIVQIQRRRSQITAANQMLELQQQWYTLTGQFKAMLTSTFSSANLYFTFFN